MSSECGLLVLSGESDSSGGGLERIISSSSSWARAASSSSGETRLGCVEGGGVSWGEDVGETLVSGDADMVE